MEEHYIFSHYKKAHRKIIYFVSVEFVIRSLPLAMGKDLTSKSFGGFWPACPLIELLRRFCFPEKYYTLNRVTDNRKSAGIILTFSRWGCMVGIRMIQYSSSSIEERSFQCKTPAGKLFYQRRICHDKSSAGRGKTHIAREKLAAGRGKTEKTFSAGRMTFLTANLPPAICNLDDQMIIPKTNFALTE